MAFRGEYISSGHVYIHGRALCQIYFMFHVSVSSIFCFRMSLKISLASLLRLFFFFFF